jgi:DNA topoisomerase-3
VPFKTTGKVITDPGWRMVYAADKDKEKEEGEDEKFLPAFVKDEHGPHVPDLAEKQTQPPRTF